MHASAAGVDLGVRVQAFYQPFQAGSECGGEQGLLPARLTRCQPRKGRRRRRRRRRVVVVVVVLLLLMVVVVVVMMMMMMMTRRVVAFRAHVAGAHPRR